MFVFSLDFCFAWFEMTTKPPTMAACFRFWWRVGLVREAGKEKEKEKR